jgi:hypothetical protein
MRRLLGIGAVVLGGVGVLVCLAAIGLGWWFEAKTVDRVTRAADRADQGLAEVDAPLARTEQRLAAVRADLDDVRGDAEKLAVENPELPRVRAAIERLLDRLLPTIDRAAALADSLLTVAAGLRAAEDVVTQLGVEIVQPSRARLAAGAIDHAAGVLNIPQARIDAVKSATAVRLTRELVELAREAAAGSERLAAGLADARREIAAARERVGQWRDRVVFWVRLAAVVHTLVWLWIGLGQLCLIGWGRRGAFRPGSHVP